jgi:hypothetical protein
MMSTGEEDDGRASTVVGLRIKQPNNSNCNKTVTVYTRARCFRARHSTLMSDAGRVAAILSALSIPTACGLCFCLFCFLVSNF